MNLGRLPAWKVSNLLIISPALSLFSQMFYATFGGAQGLSWLCAQASHLMVPGGAGKQLEWGQSRIHAGQAPVLSLWQVSPGRTFRRAFAKQDLSYLPKRVLAKRQLLLFDCSVTWTYSALSAGMCYTGRSEENQIIRESRDARNVSILARLCPPKSPAVVKTSQSTMSACHYAATNAWVFLLTLAASSVSRTGSVAAGHMVCLAERTEHRPCLLPKTKAKANFWALTVKTLDQCSPTGSPFSSFRFFKNGPAQPRSEHTALMRQESLLALTTSVLSHKPAAMFCQCTVWNPQSFPHS